MVDPGYRKMQRDERRARRRLDLERAAQSANARPHALHAGSPVCRIRLRGEACAVVMDCHSQALLVIAHPNVDMACAAVLEHVGQRFLQDAHDLQALCRRQHAGFDTDWVPAAFNAPCLEQAREAVA